MAIHVLPMKTVEEHDLNENCSCDPDVTYIDKDTGLPYPNGPLIKHKMIAKSYGKEDKVWEVAIV